MATREKHVARGTIATVVATAAVTLAVGVTGAALGGYLVPPRNSDTTAATQSTETATTEKPSTKAAATEAAAGQTSANEPGVVLVPVAPDGQWELTPSVPAAQPRLTFASHDGADHDDHHRHRGHDRDEHEDDDGDDD
jgi:hypothetical protein